MILKEQNYFNQDMMEYYTTDHNKTQEYLKIKGDQPEMKANIINGAECANKEESDPIVHPSMEKASTSVKRVGNIPIVTSIKAFGKAE